ncbi:hypothetical protein GQX73_g7392 [Xylaria multiplex]|uniref:Uncharacterized protein n=1 Tax=Xylaria multiplex TaxID=323545 RepID=A0A7C8IL40_9PEZI|nr:hypothetical protein GQX73_g7392 [Xylaria multiplex]
MSTDDAHGTGHGQRIDSIHEENETMGSMLELTGYIHDDDSFQQVINEFIPTQPFINKLMQDQIIDEFIRAQPFINKFIHAQSNEQDQHPSTVGDRQSGIAELLSAYDCVFSSQPDKELNDKELEKTRKTQYLMRWDDSSLEV